MVEGIAEHSEAVAALAASALASSLVRRAAAREYWRESYVGTVLEDSTTLEDFVDLIFREDDGTLVIIDDKTDAVPDSALHMRARHYAHQIKAYHRALTAATGATIRGHLVFVRPGVADAQAVQVT